MGCLKEWAAEPARLSAARMGDQWVRGNSSALLESPRAMALLDVSRRSTRAEFIDTEPYSQFYLGLLHTSVRT
jgi:hypothetical protein